MSLDFVEVQKELSEVSGEQRDLCQTYYDTRKSFGEAKHALFILLTPHQSEAAYRKASIEKQLLMLRADTPENHKKEVYGYYETYIKYEQNYKGLQRMIDALASRITQIQSLIKWVKENVPY